MIFAAEVRYGDGEVKPAPAPVGTAHFFFWCLVVCQWVEQKEKDQIWLHKMRFLNFD